jgi:hypothetical protein
MIKQIWQWFRRQMHVLRTPRAPACTDCEREELRNWQEEMSRTISRLEAMVDSVQHPRPKENHHGP